MKVRRVYRLVVHLQPLDGKSAISADAVFARPIIPGALVQPPEQEISPRASNSKVIFSVTPLAQGNLADARLQLVYKGKPLDEVRTPMRGTCQRRALGLGLLTLLACAYLLGAIGPLPNLSSGKLAEPGATPLASSLVHSLPDYTAQLPEGLQGNLGREAVADQLQETYNAVYALPNLAFWVMISLLVLTLLVALLNRPALLSKSRKGKPIMVPTTA